VSAALGPPTARQLTVNAAGLLRAEFGPGTATEIDELFRELAVMCVQKQYRCVLVVARDGGPAGESALRDALTVMVLAGIPSDFKLAVVTPTDRVEFSYRNAQRDLCAAGVTTRVFERESDARHWLGPSALELADPAVASARSAS
jgi:hypothetical protein